MSLPSVCLQTFIKTINYSHLMPTRYNLDVDLKTVVSGEVLESAAAKKDANKVLVSTWLSWIMCRECVALFGGSFRSALQCSMHAVIAAVCCTP
jgi:hypothetical protein